MNDKDKEAFEIAITKWEELDEWNKSPSEYENFESGWQAACEYKEAENKKLREALKEIKDYGYSHALSMASEGFEDFVRELPIEVLEESKKHKELKDPKSMPMIIWQAAKLSCAKESSSYKEAINDLERDVMDRNDELAEKDKEIERLREDYNKLRDAAVRYLDAEDMAAKKTCDKELLTILNNGVHR
jgi:predicted  nucleic acid-binding Zn-ribbon protein